MDVDHTVMLEQHLGRYIKPDSPAMQNILTMMKDQQFVQSIAHDMLAQSAVLSEATGGMLENQGFELMAHEVFKKLDAEYQRRHGPESFSADMTAAAHKDIPHESAMQEMEVFGDVAKNALNTATTTDNME